MLNAIVLLLNATFIAVLTGVAIYSLQSLIRYRNHRLKTAWAREVVFAEQPLFNDKLSPLEKAQALSNFLNEPEKKPPGDEGIKYRA